MLSSIIYHLGMVKWIAIFVTLVYVTLNVVAHGISPAFASQNSSPNGHDCPVYQIGKAMAAACDHAPEKSSDAGSKHCLFHMNAVEPDAGFYLQLAAQKCIQLATRRLIPLQPGHLKKPPRTFS